MDTEKDDIYGGISDVTVPAEAFEFGHGVRLAPAKAHLMRPYLMTFERPDSSFPAMMSARGSFGFDVVAEIKVPADFNIPQWFDRPNTVWWLAALLRLRSTPRVRVPVLSNASFGKTAQNSSSFWPVESESERTRLVLEPASGSSISNDDLEWIRAKWITGGQLMHRSSEFNLAVQAFDQSAFARDPALALLQLWSALEGVFSPSRSELRFRVSANIATFLEPAGERRAILHRRVAKLYDARSAAAHGRPEQSLEPLVETYSLLKRVLLRIIDDNYVPSISDIESALFGHVKFNTTSTESGAGGES